MLSIEGGRLAEPTYIVTGRFRSGTSMMMHSLVTGGMTAVYKVNMAGKKSTGEPYCNYEMSAGDVWDGVPIKHGHASGRGKLIKIFWHRLLWAPPGKYRVIFMNRPDEEIVESATKAGEAKVDIELMLSVPVNGIIQKLRERDDMDVTGVSYNHLCKYPLDGFEYLKQRGWPIDAKAAATVPTMITRDN